jgi:hypothetical protein
MTKAQVTLSADAQPSPEGKIHVCVSGDATDLNDLIDLLNEAIKTVETSETAAVIASAAHRSRVRYLQQSR